MGCVGTVCRVTCKTCKRLCIGCIGCVFQNMVSKCQQLAGNICQHGHEMTRTCKSCADLRLNILLKWMWPFRWPFRPSCGFSLPPPLSLFVSLLPVTPKAQGTEESHLAMLPLNCLKTSHRRCLGGSLLLGFYLIT